MSKNTVWNRGKHNGRGLTKKPAAEELPNPRIDTVKPMNRSNWVTRPARVKPENK
ncbi:hypothetical protein [Paenibacillus sp. BAC0078]